MIYTLGDRGATLMSLLALTVGHNTALILGFTRHIDVDDVVFLRFLFEFDASSLQLSTPSRSVLLFSPTLRTHKMCAT